jgi:hypothetical protein
MKTYDLCVDYTYGGVVVNRDLYDLTKEELLEYKEWFEQTYRILNMEIYKNE